jgi:hypothetical protein
MDKGDAIVIHRRNTKPAETIRLESAVLASSTGDRPKLVCGSCSAAGDRPIGRRGFPRTSREGTLSGVAGHRAGARVHLRRPLKLLGIKRGSGDQAPISCATKSPAP